MFSLCIRIDELELLPFSVYPNPSMEEITLQSSGELSFEIYDINGRSVRQGKIFSTNNFQNTIFIGSSGMYFAIVKSATTAYCTKALILPRYTCFPIFRR